MQTYNRLPHILNRNIFLKEKKFSAQEIKKCLSQNRYSTLTPRERVLISKFFKEIKDTDDLEVILNTYKTDINNIEDIYRDSPYSTCGFSFWDNKFNIDSYKQTEKPYVPLKSTQIKSPRLRQLVLERESRAV